MYFTWLNDESSVLNVFQSTQQTAALVLYNDIAFTTTLWKWLIALTSIIRQTHHYRCRWESNAQRTPKLKKKVYDAFLCTWFNYLKGTEPLQGDSLLFTSNSKELLVVMLMGMAFMHGVLSIMKTNFMSFSLRNSVELNMSRVVQKNLSAFMTLLNWFLAF